MPIAKIFQILADLLQNYRFCLRYVKSSVSLGVIRALSAPMLQNMSKRCGQVSSVRLCAFGEDAHGFLSQAVAFGFVMQKVLCRRNSTHYTSKARNSQRYCKLARRFAQMFLNFPPIGKI